MSVYRKCLYHLPVYDCLCGMSKLVLSLSVFSLFSSSFVLILCIVGNGISGNSQLYLPVQCIHTNFHICQVLCLISDIIHQ